MLVVGLVLLSLAAPIDLGADQEPRTAELNQLIDQYFDFYFQNHPTAATAAGFHQYDDKLEDFSRPAIDSEIAGLKKVQAQFDALTQASLPADAQVDRDLVTSAIKARLLELENIQMWRKDPDQYTSSASYSVFLIMKRNFAPADERLRSLIARERQIPKVFEAARRNLENPPRVYTEVALQQLPDVVGFFKNDVPAAFASVKDPKLVAEFKQSNGQVVRALQNYENFLRADLLPNSRGDFRIGAENYRRNCSMKRWSMFRLIICWTSGTPICSGIRKQLKIAAAKIDPKKSPSRSSGGICKRIIPPPTSSCQVSEPSWWTCVSSSRKGRSSPSLRRSCRSSKRRRRSLVRSPPRPWTRPARTRPKPRKAFFNVTLPDSKWNRTRTEEWMEGFNHGVITSTAIHEVFPGHLHPVSYGCSAAPSKARKLLDCGSNAEGWAHYTEQMMLDEGYGKGIPRCGLDNCKTRFCVMRASSPVSKCIPER